MSRLLSYAPLGLLIILLPARAAISLAPEPADQPVTTPRQGLNRATADAVTYQGPADTHAFSKPSANMPPSLKADFFIGDSLFQRLWISAPASVKHADGLGPLFNSRACQSCHIKDGRGHLPTPTDSALRTVIIKLAIAEPAATGQPAPIIPEPTYGFQFHDQATAGVPPEGHYTITYTHHPGPTRTTTTEAQSRPILRKPHVQFSQLNYGPLHPKVLTSLRVAPPMIGLGLIEAIPRSAIATRHDPDDIDGDGISGRLPLLQHIKPPALGRFGWKAAQPSLLAQNLTAFFMDMSMTSSLHPDPFADCTPHQTACRALIRKLITTAEPDLDVPAAITKPLVFYTQNLAPPQRNIPPDPSSQATILAGEKLFYDIGCESCHRAHFTTGSTHPLQHLHHQHVFLYSDLLLHDMGPGLDDGYHTPHAQSSEWRTPPLWGLGYTQIINPRAGFLHDGRAATITEAILWHDGEARAAAMGFTSLSASEQQALLMFLGSL